MCADESLDTDLGDIFRKLSVMSKVLTETENRVLLECLKSVIDRVLLGRLITDDEFAIIRRYPSMYLAESAERIEGRLCQLDVDEQSRTELVPKLKTLLVRSQSKQVGLAQVSPGAIQALFARIAATGVEQLRCNSCGYHFRVHDMGSVRRQMAENAGLEMSRSTSPNGRQSDPIKRPIFTGLEIDHVIPRVGWGPSDASNLQVLCQLCNQGKLVFQSGFEAISLVAAGSYSLDFSIGYLPNRTIFYASMLLNDRTCSSCGRRFCEVELTVRPRSLWFTPWTVDLVCYDCFGDPRDREV